MQNLSRVFRPIWNEPKIHWKILLSGCCGENIRNHRKKMKWLGHLLVSEIWWVSGTCSPKAHNLQLRLFLLWKLFTGYLEKHFSSKCWKVERFWPLTMMIFDSGEKRKQEVIMKYFYWLQQQQLCSADGLNYPPRGWSVRLRSISTVLIFKARY